MDEMAHGTDFFLRKKTINMFDQINPNVVFCDKMNFL